MKTSTLITSLLYLTTFASALPPQTNRDTHNVISIPDASTFDPALSNQLEKNQLEKRRGGGGGRGGGSSGGSSSGGRTGSSGGGRVPTSDNSFSSSSNLGGRTRDGSGSPPSYGGRYVGGAAVPYTAGARRGGIAPFLLPIGALAIFPALWLFPVYAYPYNGYYGYNWRDENGRNRTANVTCLCQEYSVCGCEDPSDSNKTALAQQLTNGTGTGAPVNTTTVRLVDYGNGNTTAYINGTLENGTTAPGGTDPSNEDELNGAARLMQNYGGYWLMIAVVGLLVNVA